MTWEETINFIRKKNEFKQLVETAYLDKDLNLNLARYLESEEFEETLILINNLLTPGSKIADIGCGNGITSIAFALKGFDITAVEPNPSDSIGAGAVKILSEINKLNNIKVVEKFGENTGLKSESYDLFFCRQALHHASNLEEFTKEAFRIVKPKGYLFAVREHVVFNDLDKNLFLQRHPLHKYYNGENAFTLNEYIDAINKSGFEMQNIWSHYESVINYSPLTKRDKENLISINELTLKNNLKKKIGTFANIPVVYSLYKRFIRFNARDIYDENKIPGRLYSFLAQKK